MYTPLIVGVLLLTYLHTWTVKLINVRFLRVVGQKEPTKYKFVY